MLKEIMLWHLRNHLQKSGYIQLGSIAANNG
jgi:hypothetical protein